MGVIAVDHAATPTPLAPHFVRTIDPPHKGEGEERSAVLPSPQPDLNPVMAPSWILNLNRADIVSWHKAKSTNGALWGEFPARRQQA